jgi:hypothetical protein
VSIGGWIFELHQFQLAFAVKDNAMHRFLRLHRVGGSLARIQQKRIPVLRLNRERKDLDTKDLDTKDLDTKDLDTKDLDTSDQRGNWRQRRLQ